MKFVICLALLVTLAAADADCNKIVCGTPTGTDTCASHAEKTWTVKACGSGKHCEITGDALIDKDPATKTYKCKDTPKPTTSGGSGTVVKAIAGLICSSNDGCHSGTCSSNTCAGAAKGADCVTYATGAAGSDADKKKICGANMYCKDAKCVEGIAAGEDCSVDDPCATPNVCIATKCVAPASVDADKACASHLQCKADHYCNVDKCAAATVEYTKGGSGHRCLKDADCAPGTCLSACDDYSTDGSGECGPADAAYVSKKDVNAYREANKDKKTPCPLKATTCFATTPKTAESNPPKRGDCYKDFKYGTGLTALYNETSSAFQIALSMCFFFLFALF